MGTNWLLRSGCIIGKPEITQWLTQMQSVATVVMSVLPATDVSTGRNAPGLASNEIAVLPTNQPYGDKAAICQAAAPVVGKVGRGPVGSQGREEGSQAATTNLRRLQVRQ